MKEFEFEAKLLITEEDFKNLINKYDLKNRYFTQVNYYFETEDNFFEKNNCALRIRNKEDEIQLTIKVSTEKNNVEYHTDITVDDFNQIMESRAIDLKNYSCPFDHSFSNLQVRIIQTDRYNIGFEDHFIEIDRTTFNETVDYEIEVESTSKDRAKEILSKFAENSGLHTTTSKPKIARYYDYNE